MGSEAVTLCDVALRVIEVKVEDVLRDKVAQVLHRRERARECATEGFIAPQQNSESD